MISVRAARLADVGELVRLVRGLAEYEKLLEQFALTEDRLREALFGERPAAEALIGEIDAEAAGYALFFRTYSTFTGRAGVYLEDLFVEPDRRGGGLGRALLAAVAARCVEAGGSEARLEWAVLDWNRPAIDFYERLGARPNSMWITYRLAGRPLAELARTADIIG